MNLPIIKVDSLEDESSLYLRRMVWRKMEERTSTKMILYKNYKLYRAREAARAASDSDRWNDYIYISPLPLVTKLLIMPQKFRRSILE